MKHLLFIFVIFLVLSSCKKEITQERNHTLLLENVKQQLHDSLSLIDFQQLDFNKTVITSYQKNKLSILRIPFTGNSIENNFLLLKIENDQYFSLGRIINIKRNIVAGSSKAMLNYNGAIKIYTLNRNIITASTIKNGYVAAFHLKQNNALLKEDVAEIPLMPEVILYASYPPTGNTWSYSTWYNIQSFFNSGSISEGGATGSGGYYSNSDPGYYNGELPGGGATPYVEEPILIDYETVENLAAIDVKKYLQCFKNIPDVGATCSIRILTDLPVDADPFAFFNWENGSPGHTFLQITKSNGTQRAQQNIGFYPVSGWKNALTPAPEDGKFVDNAEHEFNASLTMNLTPDQLQSTLAHMQYLANFIKYDIDDYNCTDFALEVFNYKRGGNQLEIPKYNIPGGSAPFGTSTPQGLYQKLKEMKESSNVSIPGVKGFVGKSNGPCN